MLKELNIWQVIAGVGIFLIGIQMLEAALKNMMGRPFKLFLRKQTSNPFKAILGGTIVTAVLQSSSAVNFMVLAFVSTGVITMRNAFAVIMGTNLGTTLDSWIIATVGFKVDIEAYAYPVVGIAGMLIFIYGDRKKLHDILSFLIGFSFLFIGLGFMKEAMSDKELEGVFSQFAGRSNFVFLLIGLIVTTITQSSSATIAITLSILHSKLIGFDSAIAVVIGSEVGTSLKLILGSLNGIAAKKRVAFGNFIYNIVTTIIGFAFLTQISNFITGTLNVKDPLIGLVVFQSGINFLNISLFLPFLNPFSRLIEKMFTDKNDHVSAFIYKTKPDVPDAAIDLLTKESEYFIYRSMLFNLATFEGDKLIESKSEKIEKEDERKKFLSKTFPEQYEILKQHHGEIQAFYIQLKKHSLNKELEIEADTIISAVRSCMHGVKCIKDVHSDTLELQSSSNDAKYKYYQKVQKEVKSTYKPMLVAMELKNDKKIADELLKLLDRITKNYNLNLEEVYEGKIINSLSPTEIATLMNINRELFTSHKAMVMSLKSLLLPPQLQEQFSEIPTYQS